MDLNLQIDGSGNKAPNKLENLLSISNNDNDFEDSVDEQKAEFEVITRIQSKRRSFISSRNCEPITGYEEFEAFYPQPPSSPVNYLRKRSFKFSSRDSVLPYKRPRDTSA